MSREVGGSELTVVLRNLGSYLRQEGAIRSEVEARQSGVVNAARLGVAAPWVVLLLLATRPEAAAAYNSVAGAGLVVGGLVVSVVAYRVMITLGPCPRRRWFAWQMRGAWALLAGLGLGFGLWCIASMVPASTDPAGATGGTVRAGHLAGRARPASTSTRDRCRCSHCSWSRSPLVVPRSPAFLAPSRCPMTPAVGSSLTVEGFRSQQLLWAVVRACGPQHHDPGRT